MKSFNYSQHENRFWRRYGWMLTIVGLSSCTPIYQAPPALTAQTGASITGIVNPMGNLVSTGTHICMNAIDSELPRYGFGGNCDKPILLTPGRHSIEISADFHPFPAEFGMGTLAVDLEAGGAYFIRATGGPVVFKNTDGHVSTPNDLFVTVWIVSDVGTQASERLVIPLQSPQPIPVIIQGSSK